MNVRGPVLALAACLSLASPAWAEPRRWRLDAEVVGSGRIVDRADDTFQELRLDRAEAGGEAQLGPASDQARFAAVLRAEAVRSAAPDSTFGVDGDSLLLRLRQAELRGRHRIGAIDLEARGGLLADPWTAWLGEVQPLRPMAASASEDELRWEPGDIGAAGRVARGPFAIDAAVTTGEGRRYPERNTGVTTTIVLAAHLGSAGQWQPAVRVAVVGRDGSIGPGAARDQRLGAAATARATRWSAGAELVAARGLADDGAVTGAAWAAWAYAALPASLRAGARAAGVELDGGAYHRSAMLAVGVAPATLTGTSLGIYLAVQHDAFRGTPWPGIDSVDRSSVLLVLAADTRRGNP